MDYPLKTPEQLAHVLRGFRAARHLTQAKLGKKTGLAQNAISDFEREAAKASIRRLFRMLSALDVELVLRDSTTARQPLKSRTRSSPEW